MSSDNPDRVEENLEIHIVDPSSVDQQDKEVQKIEKIVKKKEELTRRYLAAGISPLTGSPHASASNVPLDKKIMAMQGLIEGLPPHMKSRMTAEDVENIRRASHGQAPIITAHSSSANIPATARIMRNSGLIHSNAPITPPNFTQQITNQVKKDLFGQVQSQVNDALALIRNPIGFIGNKLNSILRVATPFAVAGFALDTAEEIFDMIKRQFGPGGLFDTRKMVLDNVKAFSQLDTILRIRSGQVFFTADAGQRLRQVAPEYSNTRLLRDGHRRYNQLNYGV